VVRSGTTEIQTIRPCTHSRTETRIAGLHRQARDAFERCSRDRLFELEVGRIILAGALDTAPSEEAAIDRVSVALHRLLVVDPHARLAAMRPLFKGLHQPHDWRLLRVALRARRSLSAS